MSKPCPNLSTPVMILSKPAKDAYKSPMNYSTCLSNLSDQLDYL
jgi:hypothetical protein